MNFEDFRVLLSELTGISISEIHEQATFRNDLAIDSLHMVNLIIEVATILGTDFQAVSSLDDFSSVRGMYESLRGGK